MTINRIDKFVLAAAPEDIPVLRNDLLLPKRPFSCIVVFERGLRSSPESPLFNQAIITPLSMLHPLTSF